MARNDYPDDDLYPAIAGFVLENGGLSGEAAASLRASIGRAGG